MKIGTNRFLRLQKEKSLKFLFEIIRENDAKIAFEYEEANEIKKITYREWGENSQKIAYQLNQILGQKHHKHFVGLHLDNCPEWLMIFWGLIQGGYHPLLLDFRASSENLLHLLQSAGAVGIITNETKPIAGMIQIQKKDLLAESQIAPPFAEIPWGKKVAFCTSGTTATSKVFVYDESAILENSHCASSHYEKSQFMMLDGSKILAFLPLYHIFGLFSMGLWPMIFGSTLVFLKDRAPSSFLDACQKFQITDIYGVPLLWNNLAGKIMNKVNQQSWLRRKIFAQMQRLSLWLQTIAPVYGSRFAYHVLFHSVHKNLLGNHLRGALSGGAYLSPETLRFLISLGIPMNCGYGMTEAGIVSVEVYPNLKRRLSNSLGEIFPSVEAKVVPVDGKEGNLGQIYLRGASLHTGRMVQGKTEAPIFDPQGWFATGDLGKIEKDALYLQGRCKDTIIKASGENVYPDELEDSFRRIPGIQELCILGLANHHSEDITLVFYTPEQEAEASLNPILAQIYKINQSLPVYKRLDQVLLSRTSLPSTTSMKPQRQRLQELLKAGKHPHVVLKIEKPKETNGNLASPKITEKANLSSSNTIEEVKAIFAQVLGKAKEEIGDEAHFIEELGGDSLQAIELAAALEKKYGIFLSDTALLSCTNVREITDYVLKQLGQQESSPTPMSIVKTKSPRAPIASLEETPEFKAFLHKMESAGDLNPYFVRHDSIVKDTSRVDNREIINLASYNYLGMSGHPAVMQAAREAILQYGTSASGSRLLTGEKSLYRELEYEIAQWKGCEDAIVLVSGHATNVTFVGNFCSEHDLILYDALSHNSIDQGARLSKSESKAFPHNDAKALEAILAQYRGYYEKVLIVVEGVYSMDGDIAPIPEFVALKKRYGAFLMVDEAHSACVLGERGKGVDEYFHLAPSDIDIRMGTLSKGLGSCGGYLAGSKNFIEYLRYTLPGFVFSVGIPPASAAAALASLRTIQQDPTLVARLHHNIDFFLTQAHQRNFHTCLAQRTAIIPILIGREDAAFLLSKKLQKYDIFVPPAIYPAVPKGKARLRFCVTSEHKEKQIIYALDTLQNLAQEEGILLPCWKAAPTPVCAS